ncbi:MAG: dockerin type I domain-containing protein, partial [Ruminococcus sp.]|nr:dockerin type I domain-containing protein [Ruminococcus sp.]
MKKIITALLTTTMFLNVFSVSSQENTESGNTAGLTSAGLGTDSSDGLGTDGTDLGSGSDVDSSADELKFGYPVTTKNGSRIVDITYELDAEEFVKTIFSDNQADFEKIAEYFNSLAEGEKLEVDFYSDSPTYPEELIAELANLKEHYDIWILETEPKQFMSFEFFPETESIYDLQIDWELTPLPQPSFGIIYAEDVSALPIYYSDVKNITGNWYYNVANWDVEGLTAEEWNSPVGNKEADIRTIGWLKNYLLGGNAWQLTNDYCDFDADGNFTAIDLALLKNKVLTYDYFAKPPVLPNPDDVTAPSDGDKFTVVAWDSNDLPYLLSAWKGDLEFLESNTDTDPDNDIAWLDSDTYKNSNINFVQVDAATSSQAPALYEAMFLAGEDVDVFNCENATALKYMDSDRTLPLSEIGLSLENFPDRYGYTDALGTSDTGELKGLTWQACPGGFAYRADLAEKYLGVTSPDQMQSKIRNWVNFERTAKTLYEESAGETAIVAALDNVWTAYSQNKSLPWFDETGNLQIDPNIRSFVDYGKNMRDSGYIGDKEMWTLTWFPEGQTDKTLGYFVSSWGLSDSILMQAAGGVGGPTYGKWALCRGPQEYFWGGTWLAVNSDTDNGLDAQSFLYSVCGDSEIMRQYALHKGEFVNNTKVMNQIVESGELTEKNADGTYRNKNVGNLGGQ